MSYKKTLEKIREDTYNQVEHAVIKNGGRIYTFYKKNGLETESEKAKAKQYDFSPLVGIISNKQKKSDSIGFVALHEIYIKENELMCKYEERVKDESTIFEASFKYIISEYLYMVLYWLTFNGFMPYEGTAEDSINLCDECGEYYGKGSNILCNSCGEKSGYLSTTIEELPVSFFDTWHDRLGLMEVISINKDSLSIYSPERNYIAAKACSDIMWATFSLEKKREIWLNHFNPDL